MKHTTLTALLVCAAGACNRQPEPSLHEAHAASATSRVDDAPPAAMLLPPTAPAAAAAAAQTLQWTDPKGWTRSPSSSPMRLATYRVPMAAGDAEDAELSVFHFGSGQGGDVDANFDRWVSQFQGVDRSKTLRSERTVAGLGQHVLEIPSGAFAAGGMRPGEPTTAPAKANYSLLGAIVESPDGPYFFKLVGPEKTIKAARAAFFSLLDSISLRP